MTNALDPDQLKGSLFRVWLALFASLGVYALFAAVFEPHPDWTMADDASWTTVAVVAVLAVATVVAIRPFRRWSFFDKVEAGEFAPGSQPYLQELRTTSAATWAMATLVTIFGLIAYFFSFSFWVFLPFLVASIAVFLIYRTPHELIDARHRSELDL